MRTYAWVAAALAVALTTGCKDRDRGTADDRVEATGERAGDAVREGAHDVGEAADTAGDKLGDAARDVGNATEDAARRVTGTWTYEKRDEYRQEARTRLEGARPAIGRRTQERQRRRVGGVYQGRRGGARDPQRRRPGDRSPEQGDRGQLERGARRPERIARLARSADPGTPAGREADGRRRTELSPAPIRDQRHDALASFLGRWRATGSTHGTPRGPGVDHHRRDRAGPDRVQPRWPDADPYLGMAAQGPLAAAV